MAVLQEEKQSRKGKKSWMADRRFASEPETRDSLIHEYYNEADS